MNSPARSLDQKALEAQDLGLVQAKFREIKSSLAGNEAILAIVGTADLIKHKCEAKRKDIARVERGHAHIEPDAQLNRLDTAILQFEVATTLGFCGNTAGFRQKLAELVKSTLREHESEVHNSADIQQLEKKLKEQINQFLDSDEGRIFTEKAAEHKKMVTDHRKLKGYCLRVEPDPYSPENKLKYAFNLLSDIANGRESDYY